MALNSPNSPGHPDPIRDLLDEESLADEISKAIKGNDCPSEAEMEAYVKNELPDVERTEVKSHLTFCGRCKRQVRELTSTARTTEADNPNARKAKSPRAQRGYAPPREKFSRWMKKVMTRASLVLALAGIVYFLWPSTDGDFPYSSKVVYAHGETIARKNKQFFFEIRTPAPIYLIEITINGKGQIHSRIPPGPKDSKFSDRDRFGVTAKYPGSLDVYLIPCAASEGFPNRTLAGLLEFLKTENTLSRDNQRSGVEMALGLYRLRYLHEIIPVHP